MRITMTDWIHQVLDGYIKEGDCCIDATMGKVEILIIYAVKQE